MPLNEKINMDNQEQGKSAFNFLSEKKENGGKFSKSKEELANYLDVFQDEKKVRGVNIVLTGGESMPEQQVIKSRDKENLLSRISNFLKSDLKGGQQTILGQGIIKTNLIKGETEVSFVDWGRNIRFLVINIFLTTLVLMGAYFGLVYWDKQTESLNVELVQKIGVLNDDIKKMENSLLEVNDFEKKLTLVSGLLDNHIYWTNFFKFLEDNTLSNVEYSGDFSGTINGNYVLGGRAPKYSFVTDQVRVLQDKVKTVKVEEVKTNVLTDPKNEKKSDFFVEFALSFSIDPNIYFKKK